MNKTYNLPVSVKGIVFENRCVWLRKNERNKWELPGGKLDEGEQPDDTVVREMKEELGFNVKVKDIIESNVYIIKSSKDESHGVLVIIYLCEVLGRSGQQEIKGEAGPAEFNKFSIDDITNLNMPQFYKEAINKAWKLIDDFRQKR